MDLPCLETDFYKHSLLFWSHSHYPDHCLLSQGNKLTNRMFSLVSLRRTVRFFEFTARLELANFVETFWFLKL